MKSEFSIDLGSENEMLVSLVGEVLNELDRSHQDEHQVALTDVVSRVLDKHRKKYPHTIPSAVHLANYIRESGLVRFSPMRWRDKVTYKGRRFLDNLR